MTGLLRLSSPGSRLSRRLLLAQAAAGAATAMLAGPAVARQATPGAALGGGSPTATARERLTGMLSLLPPSFLDVPDANIPLFMWADLGSQLAAFGSPDLVAGEGDIIAVTGAMYIDVPLIERSLDEEAREIFGFSVLEADQVLSAGAIPDRIVFYAFADPVDHLSEAWEAAGYERIEGEDGEFWTIGEDGELDLGSDIGRMVLANMNNLAIVEGTIVVAARTSALLGEVLAMLSAGQESAADQADLLALVETIPDDTVNVLALHGDGLEASSFVPENPGREARETLVSLLAESDDAVGPMPQVALAIVGITAGMGAGPGVTAEEPVFFGHLAMDSPEDAAQAAAVVAWRMEHMTSPTTGYPFAEGFVPVYDPAEAVAGNVALTTFTGNDGPVPWSRLVMSLDMWPFAWLGEA